MKRIAIVNKKGGVGKTTTAVNLSAALAEQGCRVLLLDLDGQRNATQWCLGLSAPEPEQDIADVLMDNGDPTSLVVDTAIPGVQLIPAGRGLSDAELKMTKAGSEVRLRRSVEKWPQDWDYIIIDCPPDMKKLTASAIIAATDVLIVSKPGTMDLAGMQSLLADVEEAREYLNPELNVSGILLSQADPRTLATRQAIEMIRESFPGMLFDTVIRMNVRFLEAHGWAEPITTYAPRSTGAKDYRALARELAARNGGAK